MSKILDLLYQKNSFRYKLLLTIFLIIIMISTLFSIISINSFTIDEIKGKNELLGAHSNHTALEIFQTIQTNKDIFETLSNFENIYTFAREVFENVTLRELFAALSDEEKIAGNFYINHTSKFELYPKILSYFTNIINTVEDVAMIRIFAPDGNLIVGSAYGEEDTKDYKGDKSWFSNVIGDTPIFEINETEISPISQARRQFNESSIRYVKAISSNYNERQAVLIMNINAERITKSIENNKIGETGFDILLNLNYETAEGNFLGEIYLAHGKDRSLILNETSAGDIVFKRYMFQDDSTLLNSGFISFSWNDTQWEGAFTRVALNDRETYVVSSMSSTEYYSNIDSFRKNLILNLIIVLTSISSILYFITTRSLKPLVSLLDATTIIAKGNLEHKLSIQSNDEFGILSYNFNLMIDSIKSKVEHLQESELRYKMLFSVFPVSTIVFQENSIKLSNPEFGKMFGYEVNDVTMALDEIFMRTDGSKTNIQVLLKETSNSRIDDSFYGLKKNGDKFPLRIICSQIDFMGKEALIAFFEDISDKIHMEEERFLKMKFETLSLFAGGIAHDFNNMLMLILGNVNILQQKISSPEHLSFLAEIEKTVQYAKKLTIQFLTFSKGGEPVIRTALIEDAIKDIILLAIRGSNCTYNLKIEKDLPPIDMDLGQITQTINNIIINAIQAMPDGGVVDIVIKKQSIDKIRSLHLKDSEYIEIAISDTGLGIPEEIKDKIFSPYFTTKEKGTGLGLTTAYSIIHKHDGCIKFDTSKWGTTFRLYLPISDKTLPLLQKQPSKQIDFSGKVLFMDDDESLQKTVSYILENLGFKVTVTAHGEECIEEFKKSIIAKEPYRIVILDLTIQGGMGGRKTIEELVKIDPDIKVIVSSGYSNDDILANYEKYGFKGILCKPFKIDELMQELSRVLEK